MRTDFLSVLLLMQPLATLKNLAEEEGLEPSDAGIKTQCLNQLGDSPIF